jgi:WD40 repeat protein
MNCGTTAKLKIALSLILLSFLFGCNPDDNLVTLTETQTPVVLKIETAMPTEGIVPVTATLTRIPTVTESLTPIPALTPEQSCPSLWAEWKLTHLGDAAAWSPDGKHVVFSDTNIHGLDDQTSMYAIDTRQLVWQVNRSTSSLTFSPDGKYLVAASNQIEFWDVATGKIIDSFVECERCDIFYLTAFAPEDSVLWVSKIAFYWDNNDLHANSSIGTWIDESSNIDKLIEVDGAINAFEINSDGSLLVATVGLLPEIGNRVYLWDLATNTIHCDFPGETAAFSPVENMVATTEHDGKIAFFDTITCELQDTIEETSYVSNMAFSPDGQILVVEGQPRGKIKFLSVSTHELLFEVGRLDGGSYNSLAFSPDGRFLLAINSSKQLVQVWKLPEYNN